MLAKMFSFPALYCSPVPGTCVLDGLCPPPNVKQSILVICRNGSIKLVLTTQRVAQTHSFKHAHHVGPSGGGELFPAIY